MLPPVRKSILSRENEIFTGLLRRARVDAGLTQRQVAAQMEAAYSFIHKVEHNDLRMDIVQIQDYLRAIGKPFLEFMTEYDEALRNKDEPQSFK